MLGIDAVRSRFWGADLYIVSMAPALVEEESVPAFPQRSQLEFLCRISVIEMRAVVGAELRRRESQKSLSQGRLSQPPAQALTTIPQGTQREDADKGSSQQHASQTEFGMVAPIAEAAAAVLAAEISATVNKASAVVNGIGCEAASSSDKAGLADEAEEEAPGSCLADGRESSVGMETNQGLRRSPRKAIPANQSSASATKTARQSPRKTPQKQNTAEQAGGQTTTLAAPKPAESGAGGGLANGESGEGHSEATEWTFSAPVGSALNSHEPANQTPAKRVSHAGGVCILFLNAGMWCILLYSVVYMWP